MTQYSKYLIAILSAASLAACKVGKDYQRPETPLPAQFGTAAAGDSSVGAAPWKQFFPIRPSRT